MNNKIQAIVIVAVLLALQGFGVEKAIRCKRVTLELEQPQERKWSLWGNKLGVDYYGTYDHTTVNRAFIKDPWGTMMEMPLFLTKRPLRLSPISF